MEWSSDGRYIFTLTGSPFFDPENVIGRLYESEGLRFAKEYYYPKDQIGFQTPLTFDWDRDNPEEANVLIRTNYDFFYILMEKMKSQRLLSSIIYYQILIRKFFLDRSKKIFWHLITIQKKNLSFLFRMVK